jgi:hypothetical protein
MGLGPEGSQELDAGSDLGCLGHPKAVVLPGKNANIVYLIAPDARLGEECWDRFFEKRSKALLPFSHSMFSFDFLNETLSAIPLEIQLIDNSNKRSSIVVH